MVLVVAFVSLGPPFFLAIAPCLILAKWDKQRQCRAGMYDVVCIEQCILPPMTDECWDFKGDE